MEEIIKREAPLADIFTPDIQSPTPCAIAPEAPICPYNGYIDPRKDESAIALGDKLVQEITANHIADFEKNIAYCEAHSGEHVDRMVHVSTFKILFGKVWMTYYANTATEAEDPLYQEARLAFCPIDNPADMTIVTVQKAGEPLCGKTIDRLYDTILMYKGGDELYILWTASADGLYYRLWCTFNMQTLTLGPVQVNRFKVGNITNDFSVSGITNALSLNGLPCKKMFSDIGIMQKLSTRVENGETWYYTGAYSGWLNCIIKSRDFITWEYVSQPDFINLSEWENAVYVLGDSVYYFVRQTTDCMQGFLTRYDLKTGTWDTPTLIRDAQSRSDFVYRQGRLFLMHAPENREGIGIVEINTQDLSKSRPIAVANFHSSIFYPYWDLEGDTAYISYTIARKQIRFSKFDLSKLLENLSRP